MHFFHWKNGRCPHLKHADVFTNFVVISANKITATSYSLLYPSCQTALCLAWGSGGDTRIESDGDWGVLLSAATAPLLLVQALFCFSLICRRLWSKTLSVMEEAQQERRWEGRRASLTSPQPRWAMGPCLCRPPRTQHSHRQGVSHFSHLIWVEARSSATGLI